MKIQLTITKGGTALYAGVHEVEDAADFGKACAEAWSTLRQRQLDSETSVGALMDHLGRTVLDQFEGAQMTVSRIRQD
jgi:TorA maturation chaperone TorD